MFFVSRTFLRQVKIRAGRLASSMALTQQLPHINDVERLSPRVIRILGGNPGKFTLQGTNTYLIGTGPSRILIDTAQGEVSWSTHLSSVLRSENATVSQALLTHWHPDHILGVPDLINLCPDVSIHKAKSSLPSLVEVARKDTTSSEGNNTDGIHEIKHGSTFTTQGAKLTAIHCPGHTDDHIAFLLENDEQSVRDEVDSGAVFSGDNVLGHGTSVFEDLALYLQSLGAMRAALGHEGQTGKCGIIYPAHGEVIRDGRGKIDEYVKHRKEREEQVVAILSNDQEFGGSAKGAQRGWTSRELTRVIYKDVDEGLLDAAERGVLLILDKLDSEGRAKKSGEEWWFAGKAKF